MKSATGPCLALLCAWASSGLTDPNSGFNDLEAFFDAHADRAVWIKPDRNPAGWQITVNGVVVRKTIHLDGSVSYSSIDRSGFPGALATIERVALSQHYFENCSHTRDDDARKAYVADLFVRHATFLAENRHPPVSVAKILRSLEAHTSNESRRWGDLCKLDSFMRQADYFLDRAERSISLPRLPVHGAER